MDKGKRPSVKLCVCFLVGIYLLAVCSLAQAAENVYIADFLMDKNEVVQDSQQNKGFFESIRPGIIKPKEDPVDSAVDLVQELSQSLVEQLNAMKIPASRVSRFDTLAQSGVLVQGQFIKLDEGNSLKRAAVGFGQGSAKMEVKVMVSRLPLKGDNPDVVFDSKANSGKGPGGLLGLAICGNPYALAAKFVLSRHASKKDIHTLASQIAKEVQDYLKKAA
jgi:hypothetical protein